MKVLLRRNISKLGKIGEVVDVRDGYARNYLLPQRLAITPSDANLRSVEAEKEKYLKELATIKADIEAKAALVAGKEITILARANEEGHLYGSIGPAQIAAVLAEENIFVEVENIAIEQPIRRLDKYDVELEFAEDVKATIHVWVVPIHDDDDDSETDEATAATETETPTDADAESPSQE